MSISLTKSVQKREQALADVCWALEKSVQKRKQIKHEDAREQALADVCWALEMMTDMNYGIDDHSVLHTLVMAVTMNRNCDEFGGVDG